MREASRLATLKTILSLVILAVQCETRSAPSSSAQESMADSSAKSRTEGWRSDVALIAREVKRVGYAPFREISEAEFDARVKTLSDAVPKLNDLQIMIELMKLLRKIGDGHTALNNYETYQEMAKTFPVQFYLFEEGLYIIAGAPKHKDLLGARVLRFGDRTIDEVINALDPLISRDNEIWPKQRAPYYMRHPALLRQLQLIPSATEAVLTVRTLAGETKTVVLATDTSEPKIWNVLPHPESWIGLPQTLSAPRPLYLKNNDVNYWYEYIRESKTVYFQFNVVLNDHTTPLEEFCERLFKFIDERDVDRLVIDLRWNNGGDTSITLPLIHGLIRSDKVNRKGKLFVIIGRRTFSAAQNVATYIERHTNCIFVGEPTGSSPNFVGEEKFFTLPYSKLRANASDYYWQSSWPWDQRKWIAPGIYAPPTFEFYRQNRDPALEAILSYRSQ